MWYPLSYSMHIELQATTEMSAELFPLPLYTDKDTS